MCGRKKLDKCNHQKFQSWQCNCDNTCLF